MCTARQALNKGVCLKINTYFEVSAHLVHANCLLTESNPLLNVSPVPLMDGYNYLNKTHVRWLTGRIKTIQWRCKHIQ